ncbi:hypothetical protein NC797_14470 [Aquibacillus sp. 3ASR75-11]|uniref:Uncharacterized protein n=1 Tax=Terrihalobacillus insolitus TaxID=2950438 RepID=A0A9X4AND4_9BACI|nr:hypothetical protein [Terrihalobacillus insolitus]MDC3413237.1 hypothetical protein [Terrihalobacillus insolitus]MDC3425709.1 hypothetical protein [Terrihalobacillus insolitus]
MVVVYEREFDWNEWFVIIGVVLLSLFVWVAPKIFSLLESIAFYLYGVFFGMFFDHTISVRPWDFYDVNDSSAYQLIDFLSYVMYGPYSYFFLYFYVKFRIKGFLNIPYVLAWTCISLLTGWIGVQIGLFHFEKGYNHYWSLPIYLFVQILQIAFYHIIKNSKDST